MKKEQLEICESIKLTQMKMLENERSLRSLHSQRAQLQQSLADSQHNLSNDEHCLTLRHIQPVDYDGPIIKIPYIITD